MAGMLIQSELIRAINIIVHRINEPDYLSRRIYNAEQRESIINVINELAEVAY